MMLLEFFATGLIINDLIYMEIVLGRIKDLKTLETFGHVTIEGIGSI